MPMTHVLKLSEKSLNIIIKILQQLRASALKRNGKIESFIKKKII